MEKPSILIVDDNPTNLNVLLDYLHDQNHKVLIAPSGEQALQQIEHFQPDLILLDVMMPGIDGFETCRRLKADEMTKEIPVIFMTALTDTVDKVTGFNVGGVDYITKPFQHEEVLARVQAHLTIRKLQQELQQKNEVLQEKNRQLDALNADKDKFFSIIAHDLRNPLGALQSLTEIIVENFQRYEKDDLIRMITTQRDAAKHLFALLENLLTWSRIQRGMIEFQPQQINLDDIIARNFTLLEQTAEQKQIMLRSTVEKKTPVIVDVNMIDAVIRNLLSNALKFTPAGGKIEVTVGQNDNLIEVSVSDTGLGISAENIPKLFRIDAQYRMMGTANEKGTGLGLILCKEFIERHGGNIWVESEFGQGSTFKFTLPQKPSSAL